MTDHDPLCPATIADGRWRARCECDLIARARADEQERNGFGHVDELEHDLAHAEAVAAKLVEVICERDERVGYWHRRWDFAQGQMDAMGASLLAARAEVERLNIEIGKVVDSRERNRVEMEQKVIDAHRDVALARAQRDAAQAEARVAESEVRRISAEVAALRKQEWAEPYRREVLADLRAKVESGWAPELDHEARIAVLALIEEADRG